MNSQFIQILIQPSEITRIPLSQPLNPTSNDRPRSLIFNSCVPPSVRVLSTWRNIVEYTFRLDSHILGKYNKLSESCQTQFLFPSARRASGVWKEINLRFVYLLLSELPNLLIESSPLICLSLKV